MAEDGTFKSAEALKSIPTRAREGLSPDDNVIAYCRIGERSPTPGFALLTLWAMLTFETMMVPGLNGAISWVCPLRTLPGRNK